MAEYVCELPVEGMVSFVSGNTTIPVHERIVRCRNCEHYTEKEAGYYQYCSLLCRNVKPDGFCAWGELKEEK